MKNKSTMLLFLFCSLLAYSEDKEMPIEEARKNADILIEEGGKGTPDIRTKDSAELGSDEVEVDLNTDTVTSEDGINVQYGNIKMKTYEFQSDDEKNLVKAKGKNIVEIDDGLNRAKIEANDVEVSQDGDYARFYDSTSYFEVGHLTGARKPNDRIYLGGALTEYVDGNIEVKDGWFTTDPSVTETADPMDAGYHVKSRKIIVVPNEKVVFRSSNLYIGDKKISPFSVPRYAVNIRPGSKVPLSPVIGSEDDYGTYFKWGGIYGTQDGKYKGGFAPMYATDLGVMVGDFENSYKTDKYGTISANVRNALVWKKDSDEEDRWDSDLSHTYSNSKGSFNFGYRNVTENEVKELEELRDDNEDDGYYDPDHPAYIGQDRPDGGDTIGFYTLDTKFEGLGEREDLNIYGKMKLLDEKDSYQEVVDDRQSDIDYDRQGDHDLYSDIRISKDNSDYKITGYYEYLDDLDEGSSKSDLHSEKNNFGVGVEDKNRKIALWYSEQDQDDFRELRSWERTANLDKILGEEYVPWTVSKYDQNDARNFKATFGEYSFFNTDFKYKLNYEYNSHEKTLSRDNDPFRELTVKNNKRDQEYNKFENIVYEDFKEAKTSMETYNNNNIRFMVAAGRTKEEFWDREGIYNYTDYEEGEAYKKYVNESNFYETEAEVTDYSLGALGSLGVKGNLRFDDYDEGYNPDTQEGTGGGDSTLRKQLTITHNKTLYDNTDYFWRKVDSRLTNDFQYFYQNYDYQNDDDDLGDDPENIRLKNKYNEDRFTNKLTYELGNTRTEYTFDYKKQKDAGDPGRKVREYYGNNLDFFTDDRKVMSLYYDIDDHYTDENTTGENYNDLSMKKYGMDFYLGNHKFYIKNELYDAAVKDVYNTDNSNEEIEERIYGYELTNGDDKWNLEYIRGKNERTNTTSGEKEIDVDNQIYSVAYLNGGEVEHYYKATYENYDQDEKANERYASDIISFRYEYRDKRFTDEDLEKYGKKEFDKDKDELSAEDLDKVREILRNRERRSLDFDLRSINDEELYRPEYKKHFSAYVMLQKNKSRYDDTSDYWDSLEEIEARLYYSQNNWGVGYRFDQEAEYTNINDGSSWTETERDHEFSVYTHIGKPSDGWNLKGLVGINESLTNNSDLNENRDTLDRYGVEIAKENDYYQWGMTFTRQYVSSDDDYEWEFGIQFTLLTFPSMPIFGAGLENDGDGTSVRPYLFDGVKVEDLED